MLRKESSTNYSNQVQLITGCPILETFTQLGGRWKIKILFCLREAPMRYSELKKDIGIISEKMLSTQLKYLVDTGWIIKNDYLTIPPHTDYRLSEKGKSFLPILYTIYDWAEENIYDSDVIVKK
jgi:DNA-binding HxlR family transcriptional regulator